MNNQSYINKLLNGAKVEWKKLGEVALSIKTGLNPRQNFKLNIENANNYYVTVKEITTGKICFSEKTDKINDKALQIIQTRSKLEIDDILFSGIGTIGKVALVDIHTHNWNCSESLFLIKSNKKIIAPKFLVYILRSDDVKEQYTNKSIGSTLKGVRMGTLYDLQIPIPPLEVQAEIVRILDKFTELTTEITAELNTELILRKKQYQYYRDHLLTFKADEAEWKTLGEVGELIRGNGLSKKDFTETGVPAIHYGQIYTYYGTFATQTKSFVSAELAKTLKKVDTGDVVITNTSENLKDVGKAVVYLGKVQAVTGGHATIFKPKNSILGKYFAYFTQTEIFATQKQKYAKGTKVIDVSATDMSKIQIPIPPLAKQQQIVDILDKFDTLTNSITEGLPREIKLRQQQYEYYREILLNFPKA
jgi:type I restriction enzyme S subunit